MLGKRLLQSLPKTSTLTHNQKPQMKQVKTAHARSIDRKKNYATRAVSFLPTHTYSTSSQPGILIPELANITGRELGFQFDDLMHLKLVLGWRSRYGR